MDLYNREIISYGISQNPSAVNIMNALNKAIEITADCKYRRTFHSDQGWAYQMKAYAHALEANRIYQSMSHKGNCHDNSVMENFFGIMKQEMYYGVVYYSYDELKSAIEEYIRYYNEINRMLEYTPEQKEKINKSEGVSWFGKIIYSENDLKNERTFLRALTKHDIRLLINSAVHFDALDETTRTMINKSASDCYKWDTQWRYGKPYLVQCGFIMEQEEITTQKASEFILQVEWLINEIKNYSGSIEIELTA